MKDDMSDEEENEEEEDEEEEEEKEKEQQINNNSEGEEGEDDEEEEDFVETKEISRKLTKKAQRIAKEKKKIEKTFKDLNLSRPLLKALTQENFTTPTQIQLQAIPPLLKGRDICASASTGSGKTAAFVLPILERLLYRNPNESATRVLVLTPTRELGLQCYNVFEKLSKYTNGITTSLITGGMSSKKQEVDLRQKPDIIVATPGRLVDHLLNTQSFGLEDIEILVIDEADRLLELGFMEQLEQIVKACPKGRQTMLFSATMTEKVSQLAFMSLKEPIRIDIDPLYQVAKTLVQEFVRIREEREKYKEAILVTLCKRTFKTKTIIFCNHKSTAHRLKILFGFLGLKSVELHGDMNQDQRFSSLDMFREEKVDFLIASDVASRGLDVPGVLTVINFELPTQIENYVHRVGRTARAGKSGTAVSFVTDQDRKLFKTVIKNSHNTVRQRNIPPKTLAKMQKKILSFNDDIEEVLKLEKEEKQLNFAEMEATKAENLIKYHDEIMNRPKRVWITDVNNNDDGSTSQKKRKKMKKK